MKKIRFLSLVIIFIVLFSSLAIADKTLATYNNVYKKLNEAQRKQLKYLWDYMPFIDRGGITEQQLYENIIYADMAWKKFEYAKTVPEDIYLRYVLPHRVTQEPLTLWRKYLMDELTPLVKDAKSLWEASQIVNKWLTARVKFRQTERRDQSPLATLKIGWGRCEELTIVYVSACRSVGIPARQAYTPWWQHGDNNHAWTEIYCGNNQWIYDGAAEYNPEGPNKAWFSGPARNAAVVFATVYGLPLPTDEALKLEDGSYLINVTSTYTQPGKLITPEFPSSVYVCNYFSPRSVARWPGKSITLGAGHYLVSILIDNKLRFAYTTVKAGQTTVLNLSDFSELIPSSLILGPVFEEAN